MSEQKEKRVFICYARDDKVYKEELVGHLADLEEQGILYVWDDSKTKPGEKWKMEILEAINNCHIALVLMSPKSMNSDFINKVELPALLKRKKVQIIPILLAHSGWKSSILADWQALPKDGKPIKGRRIENQRKCWVEISEKIRQLCLNAETIESLDNDKIRENIPELIKPFFGREEDIKNILEFLIQSTNPIIIASGFGGIGKSSLARKIALECKRLKKFQFIAWIDTRKYEGFNFITLEFVLDKIARVYEANSKIPQIKDLEEKKDKIRDLLKKQRSLIILDNFESVIYNKNEEQKINRFIDNLPFGVSDENILVRVIITTRIVSQNLEQLPIKNYSLSKLSLEDSLKLMKNRYTGSELSNKDFETIYEKFCGLPKYIELAILQLNKIKLDYWRELVDNFKIPPDDKIYGDLFAVSWEEILTENMKQVLMALTYFVGSASSEGLRITSGLSGIDFSEAVMYLANGYIDFYNDRYSMHPLTHVFCRTALNHKTNRDFKAKSDTRFIDYFLKFFQKHHQKNPALLKREVDNALGAIRLANKQKQWKLLTDFRKCITNFLWFYGYWQERIESMNYILNAYKNLHDKEGQAECLVYDLGWTYLRLEELKTAEKYIKEGLKLFRKLKNSHGEALSIRHLGKSALLKGDYEWCEPGKSWEDYFKESLKLYEKSLSILSKLEKKGIDERVSIGNLKLDFGRLYWLYGRKLEQDGKGKEALRFYTNSNDASNEAIGIFRQKGDLPGIAKGEGNLGNSKKELGRYFLKAENLSEAKSYFHEAEKHYSESLKIAVKISRQDEISHAKWGLSEIFEIKADLEINKKSEHLKRSFEYAKDSHRIYKSLGTESDSKVTRDLLTRINEKLEKFG